MTMKATFTLSPGVDRREVLGADDVSDAELEAMVADLWDVPTVRLHDSTAEPVAYDVPSILTGARTWVRGRATAGADTEGREFTLFVKRVHNWRHSPAFAGVPPEIGEWAAASLPWRAEPLVYGSDLRERLPEGLSMPRGLRVEERPDETAVIWMEAVDADPVPWGPDDSVRAARLLGRLSASRAVAALADIDPQPWHIDSFVAGRLAFTVLPGLHDEATWLHPAVAEHFGGLRDGLLAAARHLDVLAQEFATSRHLASHGDACPNNLLRRAGQPGFTLIDFGFWRSAAGRLRPVPAAGGRHPDRAAGRRRPARARGRVRGVVRRRARRRGARGPAGGGAARPRGEPDAVQRPAEPAARAARRPGHRRPRPLVAPAGGDRPLRPRRARRHRAG